MKAQIAKLYGSCDNNWQLNSKPTRAVNTVLQLSPLNDRWICFLPQHFNLYKPCLQHIVQCIVSYTNAPKDNSLYLRVRKPYYVLLKKKFLKTSSYQSPIKVCWTKSQSIIEYLWTSGLTYWTRPRKVQAIIK